jgi:hypothetical protein
MASGQAFCRPAGAVVRIEILGDKPIAPGVA